jgi:hypothetical protein
MTTPAASLVDARRWNFTGEPTQVHRKSGRACSGRWDLGIMPPRERRMWKDREVLRLKAARAEHRPSRNHVARRLERTARTAS